jgi:hypothetical protein
VPFARKVLDGFFSDEKMGNIHCDMVVNGDGMRMNISQPI